MLFPAAVLIVLGLGALAVDSAALFLGQRRLADLAAAIATDAVAGISEDAFYDPAGGSIELDPVRARRRARQLVDRRMAEGSLEAVACAVDTDGARAHVTCDALVRPVLAPFWPGSERARRITASDAAVGVLR